MQAVTGEVRGVRRSYLLAACLIAAAIVLAPRAASAAFICQNAAGQFGDSTDGATAPGGDGSNNMACGPIANANGSDQQATAIGPFTQAEGANSAALGAAATATGDNSTALGANAQAGGTNTFGNPPNFQNANNTAVGVSAQAGATGPGQTGNTAVGPVNLDLLARATRRRQV